MITAVTIDFWNTLVDVSNSGARRAYRHEALKRVFAAAGRTWDERAVDAALSRLSEEFDRVWFGERRTMDTSECLTHLWRYLGLDVRGDAHERAVEAFRLSVLHAMPALLPGASETLRRLSRDYRLAVVSDTALSPGTALRQVLARHGIASLFGAWSFSDETGVSKPHPKAYLAALDVLGCTPEEAVHVGDIERTDIAGAKDLGMKAVLFRGDPMVRANNPGPVVTRADAVVERWEDLPDVIARLGRDS
ncbi:MAG: HAD family hydrolase [Bacteroidota bacterium]|nr:HAD family hydrolase [Bacteroidota bacterium]